MLFCSEKFYGWVVGGGWRHCNYSYKLQVQVSYQRFEIDLGPGPELDRKHMDFPICCLTTHTPPNIWKICMFFYGFKMILRQF